MQRRKTEPEPAATTLKVRRERRDDLQSFLSLSILVCSETSVVHSEIYKYSILVYGQSAQSR